MTALNLQMLKGGVDDLKVYVRRAGLAKRCKMVWYERVCEAVIATKFKEVGVVCALCLPIRTCKQQISAQQHRQQIMQTRLILHILLHLSSSIPCAAQ